MADTWYPLAPLIISEPFSDILLIETYALTPLVHVFVEKTFHGVSKRFTADPIASMWPLSSSLRHFQPFSHINKLVNPKLNTAFIWTMELSVSLLERNNPRQLNTLRIYNISRTSLLLISSSYVENCCFRPRIPQFRFHQFCAKFRLFQYCYMAACVVIYGWSSAIASLLYVFNQYNS